MKVIVLTLFCLAVFVSDVKASNNRLLAAGVDKHNEGVVEQNEKCLKAAGGNWEARNKCLSEAFEDLQTRNADEKEQFEGMKRSTMEKIVPCTSSDDTRECLENKLKSSAFKNEEIKEIVQFATEMLKFKEDIKKAEEKFEATYECVEKEEGGECIEYNLSEEGSKGLDEHIKEIMEQKHLTEEEFKEKYSVDYKTGAITNKELEAEFKKWQEDRKKEEEEKEACLKGDGPALKCLLGEDIVAEYKEDIEKAFGKPAKEVTLDDVQKLSMAKQLELMNNIYGNKISIETSTINDFEKPAIKVKDD